MEDLTIMVIEKIRKDDVQLHEENYWIHHLRSMVPEGLNLDAYIATSNKPRLLKDTTLSTDSCKLL